MHGPLFEGRDRRVHGLVELHAVLVGELEQHLRLERALDVQVVLALGQSAQEGGRSLAAHCAQGCGRQSLVLVPRSTPTQSEREGDALVDEKELAG